MAKVVIKIIAKISRLTFLAHPVDNDTNSCATV